MSFLALLHLFIWKSPLLWPTAKMHNLFLIDYQWVHIIKGKIVDSQVKHRVPIRKLEPVKVIILQSSPFTLKCVWGFLAYWLRPNYIDLFQFGVNLSYRTIQVPARFIKCKESLLLQYFTRFNGKCPWQHWSNMYTINDFWCIKTAREPKK